MLDTEKYKIIWIEKEVKIELASLSPRLEVPEYFLGSRIMGYFLKNREKFNKEIEEWQKEYKKSKHNRNVRKIK